MTIIKKPVLPFTVLTFCFLFTASGLLLIHWKGFPASVAIGFQGGSGLPILADKESLGVFLAVGFFTIGLNFFLADFLFFRERVLSLLISIFTTFFALILLVAIGFTTAVN